MTITNLIFQILLTSASKPQSLKDISLNALANNFNDKTVYEISKRIFPHIFDSSTPPEVSGFNHVFFGNTLPNTELDLSNMKLEGIPIILANKMKTVEKLNLSRNPNLCIKEEWIQPLSEKLKEISLCCCNLTEKDINAIANLKKLEKLNISSNRELNIRSDKFILILEHITHLDISYCGLNEYDLEFILEKGVKLEYLCFNGNNLESQIERIHIPNHCRRKLKELNLSSCNLNFKSMKQILKFSSLESIDLSNNNFSEIDHRIFKLSNSEYESRIKPIEEKDLNYEIDIKESFKNLKKINLCNCHIKSKEFIKEIFDLQKLEVLFLSINRLKFDFREVTIGRARNSLKVLEMNDCSIFNYQDLYHLTNLNVLEYLNISRNTFLDIPQGFELGCSKNTLKEINLSNCHLNHYGLKAVTDCDKLEKLTVSRNQFGDINDDFRIGCSQYSLKIINIDESRLNDQGLKALTKCIKLEKLNGSCNEFEKIDEEFKFGNLKDSLKELRVGYSRLSYGGLQAILNCRKLKIVNVHGNGFDNIERKIFH